ncbi:MAG: helix-turn-helix transcriptional regulator [Alphaproteobacteria bacterium]|nr:helix-turn-helix transcriptional regulator [Alphaproteobacteria bacterium]
MPDQPAPVTAAKTAKSLRTRAAILEAAQALFAEQGYERATVRDIAARAAIDPAMVIRYFGSKEGLFTQATTFDLKLPDLTTIAKRRRGAVLVAHFLEVWEGPLGNSSLVSLLRAAASSDDAANAIRTIFGGQVVPMLARVVPPAELPVRAGLVATQIMGLAVTRYVLKVPPVVAMNREQIVRLLGPTMQRYVGGAL